MNTKTRMPIGEFLAMMACYGLLVLVGLMVLFPAEAARVILAVIP